ncbi:MAG TPA: alpha/beta hydrolase [Rugosimonospora sp.]|nr:alpha/beta hydrolase [Rugosimonospora sp.]
MTFADVDGIRTRYEVYGSGPPLLMLSPGGFSATVENWSGHGLYRRLDLVARLSRRYTCIAFDKRESGESGGRLQRLSWADYVAQALGLLDHLGIERAYLIGGCVGCSIAAAVAVAAPERVAGMVLYSPAGGPRYRMRQHARMAAHQAYVEREGLAAVVELALGSTASFTEDPRVGLWASVIRADPDFAKAYAARSVPWYAAAATGTVRLMFDRDTVPGVEPEDLMRLDTPALIVPGQDESHATSAARYLQECLPHSVYWDIPVPRQTADNAPDRILDFLASA